jgi:NADH dehydrogenase
VVIIGAGFGGLTCAQRLVGRPAEVLILDRHNYHLFTPLLYQVASSLLNPNDIAEPVRTIFRGAKNVRFRMAEVTGVDFTRREVRLAGGSPVPYDYLVLAAGSTTNYFGLESLDGLAFGLKDMAEALQLRNHVLRLFETAAFETDPEVLRRKKTIVVVGAGPTGVEYAGALSELVKRVMATDYPELDMDAVRIVLVEARSEVLPTFPAALGREARRELEKRSIEVRVNARVEHADERGLVLGTGQRIDSETLVWAAGVKAGGLASTLGVPLSPTGRIVVDGRLRLHGREREFAIGDIASCRDGERNEEIPMIVPPAMQQARYVARTILAGEQGRALAPFRYRDKGMMATIGRNAGVAAVGRRQIKGFVGWVAWLALHLYYLIGFRNRLVVLLGWAWNYLKFDRPLRIITRIKERPRPRTPRPEPADASSDKTTSPAMTR